MSRQWRSDDTSPWPFGLGTGKDGSPTISSNTAISAGNAGAAGTAGAVALTLDAASSFQNGDIVIIHQSQGSGAGTNWELNKILSGGGTTSLTLYLKLQHTYLNSGSDQAQIIQVKQYQSLTFSSNAILTAPTWDGSIGGGAAIMVRGTISGAGSISANGCGFRGGTSVSANNSQQGESATGVGSISTSANGAGGGGGQESGGFGGGGGGGHAAAGTAGSGGGNGAAGSTDGSADLTDMVFGAGGGRGADSLGGNGGRGGGALWIFCYRDELTNGIDANGSAGSDASTPSPTARGGGGGGAGGSILRKVVSASLGSAVSTATAGSGGAGTNGGGNGGAGAVGRLHIDHPFSGGVTGTTNPTYNDRIDTTIRNKSGFASTFMF